MRKHKIWLLLLFLCTIHNQEAYSELLENHDTNKNITAELVNDTIHNCQFGSNFKRTLNKYINNIMLYDNMLSSEFQRRFYTQKWPRTDNDNTQKWLEPEYQCLMWFAECNKRLCVDDLAERRNNRKEILCIIYDKLSKTENPDDIIALIDIAYWSVMYDGFIIPQDGTDEIIDLLKKYVVNPDKRIHKFACDRLSYMGSANKIRYDEILQFLVDNAPELKNNLLSEVYDKTVFYDRLTGCDIRGMVVTEKNWINIESMSENELKKIIIEEYSEERSQSAVAEKALVKLICDAASEEDRRSASYEALLCVIEKNIRPMNIITKYILYSTEMMYDTKQKETILYVLNSMIEKYVDSNKNISDCVKNLKGLSTFFEKKIKSIKVDSLKYKLTHDSIIVLKNSDRFYQNLQ